MKQIFKRHWFYFICCALSIGIMTSCEDDDDTSASSSVDLISFGPSGVFHGDTISFIGNNLDRVSYVKFVGDSVLSANFIAHSGKLIKVKVPEKTEKGLVQLITPEDTIVSKTEFDLLVTVENINVTLSDMKVRPGSNLVITGKHVNYVSEVWFSKDQVVRDSDFISKSVNEIVVSVPLSAQTGPLSMNFQGTKPFTVTFDKDLEIVLPSISSFTPSPIEPETNLTINGLNLDLTMGILFKGVTDTIKTFESITQDQIVVKVPKGTSKGVVTLVAYSNLPVASTEKLYIVGDLVDLAPLKYAIYEDDFMNDWQDWGWGRKAEKSDVFVRDAEKAYKVTYEGTWGGVKFNHSSIATNEYTEITFAIYGGAELNGKTVNVSTGGATKTVIIEGGKWIEVKIPLTELGSPNPLTYIQIQETGWSGTVYFDHVGLR